MMPGIPWTPKLFAGGWATVEALHIVQELKVVAVDTYGWITLNAQAQKAH
jgi:hypothetical protein